MKKERIGELLRWYMREHKRWIWLVILLGVIYGSVFYLYNVPVEAAADGTVTAASYSSAAGNYVMIDHGGGLYTVYMHASSLLVSPGQTVSAGDVIAKVGSTGISTGSHLHFGVSLNGSYVSPWSYLGG